MYSTCKLSPVVRYTNTVINNLLHDCEENIIYMKIYSPMKIFPEGNIQQSSLANAQASLDAPSMDFW